MLTLERQYFLHQEPLEIINLRINYNKIEYSNVLIYKYPAEGGERHLVFDCEISHCAKTLIVREMKDDSNEYVFKWLKLQMWLLSYNLVEQLGDQSDFTLKIQELEDSPIFEFKFANDYDYSRFKTFFRQWCIIINPTIEQEMRLVNRIGKGAQATVDLYRTKHQESPESFAAKVYKLPADKNNIKDVGAAIINEISYLQEFRVCDNITQLEAVYIGNNKICLVTQFAKYGSILKHLQNQLKFTEEQIREIMVQLILALDLMHQKHIIHRDIKPDNILLVNKEELKVCLSDLGLACNEDDKQIESRCGTPGYVAPEVLKGYNFSPKSDIFSLGCLFYNLITGRSLFMGSNQKEVLLANKFKNPLPVIGQNVTNVSNECKNLLQWMVQVFPESRPSAEQCINHTWFSKDRQALQNLIKLNKNQQLLALYYNPGIEVYMKEDITEFTPADNYYEFVQNLSQYGSIIRQNSISSNHSSRGSASPGIKICYNSIISKGRQASLKADGNGSGSFSIAANLQEKKNVRKPILISDALNLGRQISANDQDRRNLPRLEGSLLDFEGPMLNKSISKNDYIGGGSRQITPVRKDNSNLDNNERIETIDQTDENYYQEYTPRIILNQVEKKYLFRTQINDIIVPERLMSTKNKRKSILPFSF